MKTEDEFEKIIQELRIVKWMAFVALIGVDRVLANVGTEYKIQFT